MREFLGLDRVAEHDFELRVCDRIMSGLGTLFGGAALAGACLALEETTGRPVVRATCQFISFARGQEILNLRVEVLQTGKSATQAMVTLSTETSTIAVVSATLGHKNMAFDRTWLASPTVEGPETLQPRTLRPDLVNKLAGQLDIRPVLGGSPTEGKVYLWARMPGFEVSVGLLSIIGDFVPYGIASATSETIRGSSLDNTIRVHDPVGDEWILAEVALVGARAGYAHGDVNMWSRDGRLLANASQSCSLRLS